MPPPPKNKKKMLKTLLTRVTWESIRIRGFFWPETPSPNKAEQDVQVYMFPKSGDTSRASLVLPWHSIMTVLIHNNNVGA